ncbi:MAG: UDP-N-acetylmuramoyl-tripeptide--D-alanyl-D-alanine ligase [Eubacterium sp.]|nr:UDP-N-acetylmuramoyl-tripeptide--D-alanyl-D-alanine ligase [Eubacterium sp.]
MKGMTIARMAQVCEARIGGKNDAANPTLLETEATGIVTDSRKLKPGDVFVALVGERVDGHNYIAQVFENGACAVICEREPEQAQGICLIVKSAQKALAQLATLYLDELGIPVVGITGSVGKTSTKEMIASVLAQKYRVHKTAGNFNNEIGLPLTVFDLKDEHEIAVLEMGISDFGEMSRLAAIARPDVSVITNIGICHLENLGTRDGILKAKTEVFEYIKKDATVVLNGDDDKLCTVQSVDGKKPVFYGIGEMKPTGASYDAKAIYASDVDNRGLRGIDFSLHLPQGVYRVHVSIPGEHNIYNAMAAAAVGLALSLTPEQICAGIEQARTIGGRTNLIEKEDYLVIDDCYNANPVSMKAAIDVLLQGEQRTIAVLGDMGELGADEKQLHYEVGQYVAEKGIDCLFAAGALAQEMVRAVEEYPENHTYCEYFGANADLKEMSERLREFLKPGDTILVKASHFMNYPEIVKQLTE